MEQKRSLKYLIMAACVALLVASIGGIVVGAQENVPYTEGYGIDGATLDLNDKVSIGFLVEATKVGYNAENNTVTGTVHTYAANPTGNANEGDDVLPFSGKTVKRTVGEEEKTYLLYLTDGINMVDYGVDVYARVINGEAVGQAKRVNVLELAYLMKDNATASSISKSLVGSLINYYETAYKVVAFDGKESGEASPYKLIKVEDGYIAEEGLENTTMRIAKAGAKLNLVANDASYKSFAHAGWKSENALCSGNVLTVSNSGTFVPAYAGDSGYNYNPDVNNVIYDYATAHTFTKKDMNGDGTVGNEGESTYTTATTENTDRMSWNQLSAMMVMNKVGSDYELSETFTTGLMNSSSGKVQAERKIFRDENTNEPVSLTDYTKVPNEGKKYAGQTGYQSYFFSHDAVAGNVKVSLDFMIPSKDTDGDGVYNEVSDLLTDSSYQGFILIPLNVGAMGPSGNTSTNLMYVKVAGNSVTSEETSVTYFNGFYLSTSAGNIAVTDNKGQHDQNEVGLKDTLYDFDVWYTLTFDITLNDDSQPQSVDLYMGEDLVYTRTAEAIGTTGLSENAVNGKIKLAGNEAVASIQDFSRYQGKVAVKAPAVEYGHIYTASDIDALVTESEYQVMVNNYTAKNTGSFDDVTTLTGAVRTRNYNAGSIFNYDANSESIVLTQAVGIDGGQVNVYVTNPLLQLKQDGADLTDKSAVMEFDISLPMTDTNGNGIFGEWQDFATNNTNSVMKGYMHWRTAGNFAGTNYATRLFSTMRIDTEKDFNSNGKLPYWSLRYRHFDGFINSSSAAVEKDSLDATKYSNGTDGSNTTTSITGNVNYSKDMITKRIKVVITPDSSGIVNQIDIYCDGAHVRTVYNNGNKRNTDSMTFYTKNAAFAADSSKTNLQYGTQANLYKDGFFGFNYYFCSGVRYGNVVFSNIESYVGSPRK